MRTNNQLLKNSFKPLPDILLSLELIENANDAIYLLDTKGNFIFVNKKAEEISGYKRGWVLGKNFARMGIVAPEYLDKTKKEFKNRAKGIRGESYEVEIITKRKERVPVELNTAPIIRVNKVVGVMGIVRNLSIRKALERELKRKIERLSALYDIGKTVISTLDLEKVLNLIVIKVVKLMRVNNCAILLLNKEKTKLLPTTFYSLGESYKEGHETDIDGSISGLAVKTKELQFVCDTRKDARFKNKKAVWKRGVGSFMSVPLICKSDPIGVMNIYTRKKKEFSEGEKELLQALANEAATSIENAKLYLRLKKDRALLSKVLEISGVMNSTMELNKLMDTILEEVMKFTNAQRGSFMFVEGDYLNTWASRGYKKGERGDININLNEGVVGYVATNLKPLVVPDVSKESMYVRVSDETKSELAMPLIAKNKLIGVLDLESNRHNNFDSTIIDALSLLTTKMAVVIDNVKLYHELIEKNNKLYGLYEISTALQATMDVELIVEEALKTFKKLGYDRVRIYFYNKEKNILEGVKSTDHGNEFREVKFPLTKSTKKAYKSIKERRPIIVQEKVDRLTDALKKRGVKESAALPLLSKDCPVGMISIDNKFSGKPIKEEDLNSLMTFSNQIAVAIENAQLYNKINNFNEILKDEIYQATKELQEKNKRLMELDRLKTEFVSTVSHELRTPLTSIKGYAALLLSGRLKNQFVVEKALKIINEESDRLGNLISDVLDLSRLESNQSGFKPELIDLNEALKGVHLSMVGLAAKKKIKIRLAMDKGIPLVNADKDKIKQVATNLLSNSIKFTDSGGTIVISTKDNPDCVITSVSDTGCGIKEEEAPKIFDRFYQVEGHMKRNYGGTGLGLAIVKEIIALHSGLIAVQSKVGRGTVLSFALPKRSVKKKGAVKCWEHFKCNNKRCIAFDNKELKCWSLLGAECKRGNAVKGPCVNKIECCKDCVVYKRIFEG